MNIIDRIEAAKPNFTKSDELIYNCIKEDYWIIIREASTIRRFSGEMSCLQIGHFAFRQEIRLFRLF